jgi:hypothetical protein
MGFSEDDRIRSKNKHQNEAFELYEGLKAMGYDHAYMIKYAKFAQETCTDSFRFEVLNTMVSIVRSLDEKVTTN